MENSKLTHKQICQKLDACIGDLLADRKRKMKFYPHQRAAYESMRAWMNEPAKRRGHRCYISHATGMGKSLHFIALAVEATYNDLRTIIIVPNKTLLIQIAREIYLYTQGSIAVGHISSLPKRVCDHKNPNVLYATKGTEFAQIVLVLQNSFVTNAERLAKEFGPHIVIRDEMHWAYSDPQLAAMACFPQAMIVGYSATPDFLTTTAKPHYAPVKLDNGSTLYADPQRLAATHFGRCLHHVGLREGIERGVLAPLAWAQIDLSQISFEDVTMSDGAFGRDYDPIALAKHMEKNWHFVMEVIERLYQTNEYNIRNRQVAAACPSVATARQFAEMVNKYTPAAAVVGSTDPNERERLLALFENEEDEASEEVIHALSSVYVLREGWNSRNAEILFFLRATKSRVLYEQFIGRIARKRRDGEPKVALVIDPRYQHNRFAPLNAPMLYGKPGDVVTPGGILVGPRRGPRKKALLSPYLPKGARVTITIKPVEIEYWAGEAGFIEIDGEQWGTEGGLAEELHLSLEPIRARKDRCRSRPGKNFSGGEAILYALKDMREACSKLLIKDLPKTGANGLVEVDGEIWGTETGIARELKLSCRTIRLRLSQCRSHPGKDVNGAGTTLYALKDMREACSKLLIKDLPKTGANGLVEVDGEIWGNEKGLAKELGFGGFVIRARLHRCRSRPGKNKQSSATTLYALKDMRKACKDARTNTLRGVSKE